jgi:hypothetical protein
MLSVGKHAGLRHGSPGGGGALATEYGHDQYSIVVIMYNLYTKCILNEQILFQAQKKLLFFKDYLWHLICNFLTITSAICAIDLSQEL